MTAYGTNFPYGLSVYKDDGPIPHVDTVLDVIKRSLRLLGAIQTGETPSAEESADALRQLNWMIDTWNNEKNIQPYLKTEMFPVVSGKGEYCIGHGSTADFVTERPLRIEQAAFRRPNDTAFPIDYPVKLLATGDFESILCKAQSSSWPLYLNYTLTEMPTGRIRVWPVPASDGYLRLSFWAQLGCFNLVSDEVTLPPGYLNAIAYNLAVELAPEFGMEAPITVQRKAVELKRVISTINSEEMILRSPAPSNAPHIYRIEVDGFVN